MKREDITGRWAFRPPECHGTIIYFVWLLADGTALWFDTYNAYEGGFLNRQSAEELFHEDRLWDDAETSIIVPQFSLPIELSLRIQSLIVGLNGLLIYSADEAHRISNAGVVSDAMSLDGLLAEEIKPQIDRMLRLTLAEPVPTLSVPSVPVLRAHVMKLVASPQRLAGRWMLFPEWAACPAHYGILVRSTGAVTFYDLFTDALTVNADSEAWFDRFHSWETFEDISGIEADRICQHTRSIKLSREIILDILRANRRQIYSIKYGEALARRINSRIENLYWLEIAKFLPYQPRQRLTALEPMKEFPASGDIIRNDPYLP